MHATQWLPANRKPSLRPQRVQADAVNNVSSNDDDDDDIFADAGTDYVCEAVERAAQADTFKAGGTRASSQNAKEEDRKFDAAAFEAEFGNEMKEKGSLDDANAAVKSKSLTGKPSKDVAAKEDQKSRLLAELILVRYYHRQLCAAAVR